MSDEIKNMIQKQGEAFDAYKKTAEEKFSALEKKSGTAEIDGKLTKIVAEYDSMKENVDKVYADMQTMKFNPGTQEDPKLKAHKEALNLYCRKGDASKMLNVVQVGVDADGGYACPPDISARISSVVLAGNPIRQLATVETTNRATWEMLADPNEMTASRIGEAGTRSETSTPQIGKITITPFEMYCYPKSTQQALDDGAWNFEEWLINKAGRAFTNLETTEMAAGDGVAGSQGLTGTPVVLDNVWAWGSLGRIHTGQAAVIGTVGAELVNTVDALEVPYLTNASWVMNKATFTSYRLLRAGANAANMFLFWQPSLQAGVPDKFMDYPVYKSNGMPVQATNAHIVAFGDIRAGYTIVDRIGINVIRDNITSPGFVKFHIYRRSAGKVTNFQAIKLIKCAA
jgi:HK97 family phage major capsid protein